MAFIKQVELPSVETLNEFFQYLPATGVLIWKERKGAEIWNKRYAGTTAGGVERSGRIITLHYNRYPRARLIWKFVYGELTKGGVILHIDGNNYNDKIENLKLVTWSDKSCLKNNRTKARKDLPRGVFYRNGKYVCKVVRKGKKTWQKSFDDKEMAIIETQKMRRILHDEFYRD